MAKKEIAIVAGIGLIAAIGGPLALKSIRENLADAKQRAADYVKQASGYNVKERAGQLPHLVAQISRGPRWRTVDLLIEELIAKPGRPWEDVPVELWKRDLPEDVHRVQERPTDENYLPEVYLQRIHYITDTLLKIPYLASRTTTYLVGSERTFFGQDYLTNPDEY